MNPSTILGFLALVIGSLNALIAIAINARREEREAVNAFAKHTNEFCASVAGWYSRVTNLTSSILTHGRAGTLDEARINYYKEQVLQMMGDDKYWTKLHRSLRAMKNSLEQFSRVSAKEGARKVQEMLNAFNSFKEKMLSHKAGILQLLSGLNTMGTRTRTMRLNELEIEKVTIEDYKDELVRLIERIEELHK